MDEMRGETHTAHEDDTIRKTSRGDGHGTPDDQLRRRLRAADESTHGDCLTTVQGNQLRRREKQMTDKMRLDSDAAHDDDTIGKTTRADDGGNHLGRRQNQTTDETRIDSHTDRDHDDILMRGALFGRSHRAKEVIRRGRGHEAPEDQLQRREMTMDEGHGDDVVLSRHLPERKEKDEATLGADDTVMLSNQLRRREMKSTTDKMRDSLAVRGNEDVTMRDDSAGPRRSVEEAVGIETRRGDGDATPNDQRLRRQKTADETTQEENRVALPNDKVRRREKTLNQTSRGFNTAHDDIAIQSGLAGLHRKALEMVKATTRREDDHVAMPGDQLRRREEETADEMTHFSDTACDDVVMLDGPPTAGEKLAEKSINASIGRVASKSVDVPGEVEFNEQDCRHQEAKATCETPRAESVASTTVPQVPPLNDGQDFASHVPERPASVPSLDDNHASRDKEKMPLPGKRAELRIRSRQKRGLMMMADQRQKSPKPAPKQFDKPCLDYNSEIEVRKGSNEDDDAPPTPKRPR